MSRKLRFKQKNGFLIKKRVCKNKSAVRVLFEAGCFHIIGEKNFKFENYI